MPETEYDRRLKNSILRDELSGASPTRIQTPTYNEALQQRHEEWESDFKEVHDFMDKQIETQVKSFQEVTGKSEIPQETYDKFRDDAIKDSVKFIEIMDWTDIPEYNSNVTSRKNIGNDSEIEGF